MPTIIATFDVKEDKIEEAKMFFRKLAADTRANEAGTLAYIPLQQTDQPTKFVVYEKYESDEAFAIHSKNLAAVGEQIGALASGTGGGFMKLEEI